ncbi:MAG: hypothetical protein ISS34_01705 [Candidatus Omnitrophica bacterium]|nr:hypothetical protein [Candidatus Omnitrophota bacterium]
MKKSFLLTAIIFIYAMASALCYGEYDAAAPLKIERVEFLSGKPKGYGRFQLRDGDNFKKAEDVFIYIEVANCVSERETRYYYTRLTMDVDIYYEDGLKIYSVEDTNFSDVQFNNKRHEGYIWTKIETSYLKEGEYKVEMTIRDENSDKEAFTLTTFRIL